jgi:hypothetical protein
VDPQQHVLGRSEDDGQSDDQCAGLGVCGLAGHRDWRLPTVVELQTLLDLGQPMIATKLPGVISIDPNRLVGAESWTSTHFTGDPRDEFYTVDFLGGFNLVSSRNATIATRARAVRGGRTETACVWVAVRGYGSICPCGYAACGRDPLCRDYPDSPDVYCPK